MANPTTKLSTQQMVNTGSRKRRGGRIGSGTRDSTQTKVPIAAIELANRPMITGEDQGYVVPPQLVARVSAEAPRPMSTMPQ
ncbi:Uncharacterised protein [Mycobacteroides abscessus]|nr:Uncharacterised protein [Mycobacteroides abscessus]SHT75464.1 Uncharacterised protein [Mycobacteroides abscessus subsp. abscessus]SIL08297.1 Uncharacterised protein [Mycobacteroides abscessus subsp. abscessus]SIN24762.1 Uncharacterised protein [Mycobacteroides abscessus subsp. abscessus]